MEWAAAKLPPWDAAELGERRSAAPGGGGGGGGVSFAVPGAGRRPAQDCAADLRPAAAGRRGARAAGAAAACAVDGCRSDLRRCREYHRRHKVCEAHSKTPVVVVAGKEQRFCQQCSRFHMLSEFDEVKRSCRKRLDGHNRRRRKPQHGPINPGILFPSHQVNQFTLYPPRLPRAAELSWGGTSKTEQQDVAAAAAAAAVYLHHDSPLHLLDDHPPPFSISFSGTFRASRGFPFLQDDGGGAGVLSAGRPALLKPAAATESSSGSTSDGLTRTLDPECALSLLSLSPHPATTPAAAMANVGSLHAPERAPVQYGTVFAAPAAVGGHALVSDAMFEEASQALPFSWD